MRRLLARVARAITRTRQIPQEQVCWCGIHHLGAGYIHDPTPVTRVIVQGDDGHDYPLSISALTVLPGDVIGLPGGTVTFIPIPTPED